MDLTKQINPDDSGIDPRAVLALLDARLDDDDDAHPDEVILDAARSALRVTMRNEAVAVLVRLVGGRYDVEPVNDALGPVLVTFTEDGGPGVECWRVAADGSTIDRIDDDAVVESSPAPRLPASGTENIS